LTDFAGEDDREDSFLAGDFERDEVWDFAGDADRDRDLFSTFDA
jgi:hypothetical protein